MDPVQVFVLGAPRTGTSVTALSLKKALRLPGRGESHVMPPFLRMAGLFADHQRRLEALPNLLVHRLPATEVEEGLHAILRGFYAREFPGGSFMDKTPGADSVAGIPFIARTFPHAKFIVTQRTGVEMVESFRKKFPGQTIDHACRVWCTTMEAIAALEPVPGRLLVIDQFELSNEPQAAAARICALLGRPAQAAALAEAFRTERPQKNSTHDWSRRLTLAELPWPEADKAHFRAACGAWMERFGYPM